MRVSLISKCVPFLALLTVGAYPVHGQEIKDSVNGSYLPATGGTWNAKNVGWYYTPTFSYTLDSILSDFAQADGRTVTEELYDGNPPASGGSLLASATFIPIANTFSGGSFTTITLQANKTYFVGFRNVSGLGFDFSSDPSATSLAPLRYDFPGGSDTYYWSGASDAERPILEFSGPHTVNAVPEPGAAAYAVLTGGCLVGLIVWGRRNA